MADNEIKKLQRQVRHLQEQLISTQRDCETAAADANRASVYITDLKHAVKAIKLKAEDEHTFVMKSSDRKIQDIQDLRERVTALEKHVRRHLGTYKAEPSLKKILDPATSKAEVDKILKYYSKPKKR